MWADPSTAPVWMLWRIEKSLENAVTEPRSLGLPARSLVIIPFEPSGPSPHVQKSQNTRQTAFRVDYKNKINRNTRTQNLLILRTFAQTGIHCTWITEQAIPTGLQTGRSRVRIPGGVKLFSLLHNIPAGSGADTASFLRGKGTGKAIPLQALTGPEGSRRFRLPDFKTFGTWRW
jgi:hypothetical protein